MSPVISDKAFYRALRYCFYNEVIACKHLFEDFPEMPGNRSCNGNFCFSFRRVQPEVSGYKFLKAGFNEVMAIFFADVNLKNLTNSPMNRQEYPRYTLLFHPCQAAFFLNISDNPEGIIL